MHTRIPEFELNHIRKLKDVSIIFDVGARTDTDYFEIFPDAEFHLFEPNPEFFKELEANVNGRKNVYLNNVGVGDVCGTVGYHPGIQAFAMGEANVPVGDLELPIITLDKYMEENNIPCVDYLKIDTEGYDFKVLKGASKAVSTAKYIQYEHWENRFQFHDILEGDFIMSYIGERNVLCVRKSIS